MWAMIRLMIRTGLAMIQNGTRANFDRFDGARFRNQSTTIFDPMLEMSVPRSEIEMLRNAENIVVNRAGV